MPKSFDGTKRELKTFGVVLAPSLVVSPDEFYGGFGEALRALGYTAGQRIYMIFRRPALRLNRIESPATGIKARALPRQAGGGFLFHVTCQDRNHQLTVPVIDFVWNMLPEDLKQRHTRTEIETVVFAVRNEEDYVRLKKNRGPILGVELAIDDNGQRAQFTFHQPNARSMSVPVALERLLGITNQSLGIVSEVLYIGQTDDDDRHRLEGHEKLQQAMAQCRSDQQILILIGRFKPSCVQISSVGLRGLQISEDSVNEITAADQLSIIEMTLINYFKPLMNELFKSGDELKGEIIKRSLTAAKFDAIEIHYDPNNPLMFAGTQAAGFHEEHHIRYSK